MNDATTQHAGPAVRASDAEREQTVALLQHNFADGRLTQAELEERAGAAYAAQTRAQLRDLTADLPAAQQQPARSGMVLDQRLLIILLCVHPQRPWSTGCYAAAGDQPPPVPSRPQPSSAQKTDLPSPTQTTGKAISRSYSAIRRFAEQALGYGPWSAPVSALRSGSAVQRGDRGAKGSARAMPVCGRSNLGGPWCPQCCLWWRQNEHEAQCATLGSSMRAGRRGAAYGHSRELAALIARPGPVSQRAVITRER